MCVRVCVCTYDHHVNIGLTARQHVQTFDQIRQWRRLFSWERRHCWSITTQFTFSHFLGAKNMTRTTTTTSRRVFSQGIWRSEYAKHVKDISQFEVPVNMYFAFILFFTVKRGFPCSGRHMRSEGLFVVEVVVVISMLWRRKNKIKLLK